MTGKLARSEIVVVRSIFMRSGGRPVSLERDWQREFTAPLARRGLIEIWYRQVMGDDFALRGPFVSLTLAGARIASSFFPAPRGFSGAEQAS